MPSSSRPLAGRWTSAWWIFTALVACSVPSTVPDQRPTKPPPVTLHDSGTAGTSGAAGAAGGGGFPDVLLDVDAGMSSGGSAGFGGSADAGGTPESDAGAGESPPAVPSTTNLFSELLGVPQADVDAKLTLAVNRVFGIGTGEPNLLIQDGGYRLYYELPQDPSMAFIWAADSNDVRSEGMSYGMMLAVQMDLQPQYDRLWKFASTFMQFPAGSALSSWRHYFHWQGSVDVTNPSQWMVNYDPWTGPAPDGEQYFAAALYMADRRWGSDGAVNYRGIADALTSAMLHNPTLDGRTPAFNQGYDMVVFYPQGSSATFTDPSYHLPAFYELFAAAGPAVDSVRWHHVAEVSRQYLVDSAHPSTGLHPDYAEFDGTPNAGGSEHDKFRYDAWRVVMNMAIDGLWFGDERMRTQVEKYHAFFSTRLMDPDVQNSLYALDGSLASGSGSTALTATLAAGSLISSHSSRARYVANLWNIPQQSGRYRYYQETVYLLGLLSAGGHFAQYWPK